MAGTIHNQGLSGKCDYGDEKWIMLILLLPPLLRAQFPRPNANKRLKELEEIIKERRSKYLLLES